MEGCGCMERVQVLVATMDQRDLSLLAKMNLQCGAVVANQAGRNEIIVSGDKKMITTDTRGVGLNRNIALLAADADIVVFADDDVTYYDGLEENIRNAFRQNPKADVMIFGMDMVKDGQVSEKRRLKNGKLHVWQSMRFGTYRIAARRRALLRCNIMFNQNFGGGCPFSSGEDSLFLKACFNNGLRVYGSEYVLGTCAKDSSSWFTGYHEKYFYDKGVLMRYLFPRIPRVMALYFAIRFKRKSELTVKQRVKWMLKGANNGKTFQPFTTEK